jgi:hypothetical protein
LTYNVRRLAAALAATIAAGGCSPAVLTMTMPHPARAAPMVQGTQVYEVPPYTEDHRYEVTLARWTPASVGFRIHLVNADRCGQPSSYSFELSDDRGHRYHLGLIHPVQESVRSGHLGAVINDVTVDSEFGAAVGADSRFLVLAIRPIADRACTALDFRWDFQG